MVERARPLDVTPDFSVRYEALDSAPLDGNVLVDIGFGGLHGGSCLQIESGFRVLARSPLLPQTGGIIERWRSSGPVQQGQEHGVRFADDGTHLFGVIDIDERDAGSISEAARLAYAAIVRFMRTRDETRILRYWNYFSRINEGAGDHERYRHFCTGRALGFGDFSVDQLPAATAIGRQDGGSMLQVYWLAARRTGRHIENPRQVSAYRYPRRYGPTSPSFSRAHLMPDGRLLISGTASVVGHESHHVGDLVAQFGETRSNLDSLIGAARRVSDLVPERFGAGGLLKVYLRHEQDLEPIKALLSDLRQTPWIILAGDICRTDLLVEIDGLHG